MHRDQILSEIRPPRSNSCRSRVRRLLVRLGGSRGQSSILDQSRLKPVDPLPALVDHQTDGSADCVARRGGDRDSWSRTLDVPEAE